MADDRASRAVDNEREEIEQYMAVHGLESHLNAAVNEVCLRGIRFSTCMGCWHMTKIHLLGMRDYLAFSIESKANR